MKFTVDGITRYMTSRSTEQCEPGCKCYKHDPSAIESLRQPDEARSTVGPISHEGAVAVAPTSNDKSVLHCLRDGTGNLDRLDARTINLLLQGADNSHALEATPPRPIRFMSPPTLDDLSVHGSPQSMLLKPHRHSIAGEGFESVLTDIHTRCTTGETINQDLQQKLQKKNHQLSESYALLEENKQTSESLQFRLDCEVRERHRLQQQLKHLSSENHSHAIASQRIEESVICLQQELKCANLELSEKTTTVVKLKNDLQGLKTDREHLRRTSEEAIVQLQDKLEDQVRQEVDKNLEIQALKERCANEEKARKQAEHEAQLVTHQGQSLLEQQTAIRAQYHEDVEAHKSRIVMLEDLVSDKDLYCNQVSEHMQSQERAANSKLDSLTEKFNSLKEKYDQLTTKDKIEIGNLETQLEAKLQSEKLLQRKFNTLNEQYVEMEYKLQQIQEHAELESLRKKDEIIALSQRHAQEICEYQDKLSEATKKENREVEYDRLKKSLETEKIELKCVIAELEDKLEDRDVGLSKLKDKVQKLRESSTMLDIKCANTSEELKQTKANTQSALKEKELIIGELKESLVKIESDVPQRLQQDQQVIENLKSTIDILHEKNVELGITIASQSEEITSMQSAVEFAKMSTDQLPSMKALLSKKESSKLILIAEQQRIEKEHQSAMSRKTSIVNSLEEELRSVQKENAILRKATIGSTGIENLQQLSFGSIVNAENTKLMMAKRESSNQILTAENIRIKADLKNATTWWNRDINELQRRNVAQAGNMNQMERKMTNLETENLQLRRLSLASHNQEMVLHGYDAMSYDKFSRESTDTFDQFKPELSNNPSKTKGLESSLKTLQTSGFPEDIQTVAFNKDVELLLAQAELDGEKIQLDLSKVEKLLETKDIKMAATILVQSSNDLRTMLDNLKKGNNSLSAYQDLASAEKQINRVQKKAWPRHDSAQSDPVGMKFSDFTLYKEQERQLHHLQSTVKHLISDTSRQSHEVVTANARKTELETALHKMEEKHGEMVLQVNKIRQELEFSKSEKLAMDNRAQELEQKIEELQLNLAEAEKSNRLANTDNQISKEREIAVLKSKHNLTKEKEFEIHKNEIVQLHMRLQRSEKENSKLQAEINKLHEKVSGESNELEIEIQQLHGKVQRLTVEKTELRDRFNEGLTTLKGDHDLILKERSNHIQRLHCQITAMDGKVEALDIEMQRYKDTAQQYKDDLHEHKRKSIEQIHYLDSQLKAKTHKENELKSTVDHERTQLTKALDSITRLEIECVRLTNMSKKEACENKQLALKHAASIEKLQTTLADKKTQLKQLQTNNDSLKSSLTNLMADKRVDQTKISMAQQELQHATSVNQLYKTQLVAAKKESQSLIALEKPTGSLSNGLQTKDSVSSFYTAVQGKESYEGLGVEMAELTNQVTRLENVNLLLKKQLNLTENRLHEKTEIIHQMQTGLDTLINERNGLQEEVHQLSLQIQQQKCELTRHQAEAASLKEKLHQSDDELHRIKTSLTYATKDKDSLQNKLMNTTEMIRVAKENAVGEAELTKLNEELQKKLKYICNDSSQTEQKLRDEIKGVQDEMVTVSRNLDEAHKANKGLETYILKLKKSFTTVFNDK